MNRKTDLTRAILYSVSGGVLTAAFGLLGTAQVHAEPRDTAGTPSAQAKKPAPGGAEPANAGGRNQQTTENKTAELRKKAQEETRGSSANALERRRENSEKKEEEFAKNSTAGSSNAADRRQENSEKRKEEADRKPKAAGKNPAEKGQSRPADGTDEKKDKDEKGGDEKKGKDDTARQASTDNDTPQVRSASHSTSTDSRAEGEKKEEKKDTARPAPPPWVVVDRDTKREVGTVDEVLEQGGSRKILDDLTSAGSRPEQRADFPMSVSHDSEKKLGSEKAGPTPKHLRDALNARQEPPRDDDSPLNLPQPDDRRAPKSDKREPIQEALDSLRDPSTAGKDVLDRFGRPHTKDTRTAAPPTAEQRAEQTRGRPEDANPDTSRARQPDQASNPANTPVQLPEHLSQLLYGEHKPERTDPLLPTARNVEEVPRSGKPVPRNESTRARPLPVREPEKSLAEQAEEAVEGAFEGLRGLAQDEIDQEKNAPDKNADPATLGRRVLAGGYATVHDNVEMVGEALDLLSRAKDGDPEAQREIEQRAKDTVDGIVNTATEAWNDPQGTWNRTVENAEKAVENFKEAPASGIGGILGDLAGPGKFTKPLKALDAVTPDRDGRSAEPSGTHAPAGDQPGNTTAPNSQSAPADGRGADSRRSDEDAGRVPVVVPMPVTQVPNLSRAGRSADRPSKNSSTDDRSSGRDTRESPNTPSAKADEDTQGQSRSAETGGAPARDADEIAPSCPVGNSFVPRTQVLMADGTRTAIEDVHAGDLVLATDPVTGLTQAKPVTALITGVGHKDLVEITVDTDGAAGPETATVIATTGHPFWVEDKHRWFEAGQLTAGLRVRTDGGRQLDIVSVRQWAEPRQRVHNLSVDGIHTFYVAFGTQDVLVHNAGGWQCGDDEFAETAKGNDPAWSTVRARFWKNEAAQPQAEQQWGAANIARMKAGRAPQQINPRTGRVESMELSHEPVPHRAGGKLVTPRWPDEHALIDPHRHVGN